jgi:GNAT superfamily N-acetyltransferase
LGVWALPLAWRRARARIDYALLIGWLIAAPILVYLPINVQRRLGEGLIMPVAIVAALGLRVLLRRIFIDREAWRRWVGRALIGFASLSSVFILALGVSWTSIRPRPIFIESAQIDAFEWLRLNVERDSVILASWETGNQLPVYVDARPFIGLGPETINAEARADLMQRFYRDELDAAERQALFDEPCQSPYAVQNGKPCRIAFVVYGAAERAESLGESRATPLESAAWMAALTLVYDADGVQIYRVY